jgi:CheY-like chemotaxis protein
VDDHDEFRRALRQMFEHQDVSILEAASGEEAVRLFEAEHPDSVILDARMPGMGGFQATRAIRELDPSAKVFIMSQFTEAGQQERSREAGAVDFFAKDDLSRLVEAVRTHLAQP